MKLYRVIGKYQYQFGGWSSIIIRVTKETNDKIYGVMTNLRGNQGFGSYDKKNDRNPIVIIKSNISCYEELKK